MAKDYKWQAWNASKSGKRESTAWLPTAIEAKNEFFRLYPRLKKCNIAAAVEQPCGNQVMMMSSPFSDPYIAGVTKDTVIEHG